MDICCMAQETQTGALYQPGEVGWGEKFKREGICVHLWLIHVDVWQKPTQHCKTIILQLKIKKEKFGDVEKGKKKNMKKKRKKKE